MKKVSTEWNELLLDYLDGSLSGDKIQLLKQELASSAELRARLEELKVLTEQFKQVTLEHPSKNFTQRVMEKLHDYPVRSSVSVRNSIWLLAGVLVAIGLGSFLLATGIFDTPGSINLNQFGLDNKIIQQQLPTISFNGKLIVNIIIILNIALAFLVLDRAILRPWFERRTHMNIDRA
jgi:hypothetical protein